MKTIFVFLVCCCVTTFLYGQTSVETGFVKSGTGFSLRGGVGHLFPNRLEVGGGLKVIYWKGIIDNRHWEYRNRFRPETTGEMLGAYGYLNYYLLKGDRVVQPFVGTDFSFSRSSRYVKRNKIVETPSPFDGSTKPRIEEVHYVYDPIPLLESHLSAGLNVRLFDQLYLDQKVGFGVMHMLEDEYGSSLTYYWEFAWMWNIGLNYSFEKKDKPTDNPPPQSNF